VKDLILGDSLAALMDYRGKTPKKLGADFTSDGVPVVSAQLVSGGRLNLADARYVPQDVHDLWMSTPTRRGDVLLTSEAPLGRVARVPSDAPLVLGQRLFGLRGLQGVLDNGFLFYALQTGRVQSDLIGRSTGSTVHGIRQSALRHIVIPAPEFGEQQAIAEVLGSLDDKIAANADLVETADALVRAWFAAIAKSPNDSTTIGQLAIPRRETVDPRACSPGTPYIGLEHIPRRRMWMDEGGRADGVTSGKSRFGPGDILFGKLRPYFHKVISAPDEGICSTDVLVLRPRDPAVRGFLLAAVASDEVVASCTARSEGTRMPRTSWQDLASVEIPWPGDELARTMARSVDAVSARVQSAVAENAALVATRDALLPALMSGELRVKNVLAAEGEVA
jgi:type I restriction enzyme S subunit